MAFPDVFRVPTKDEIPENEQAGWSGGFDVVLGNPPWERIKIQEKEWFASRRPNIANAANATQRRRMISNLMYEDPSVYTAFLEDQRQVVYLLAVVDRIGENLAEERGTLDMDMNSRLRVGRAIAKTEEEVAPKLMEQIKKHQPEEKPPALATDGRGAYREAMVETWGKVPEYSGHGRPPTTPKPEKDWQYLQVTKKRDASKLISVKTKVIYGDPQEVKALLGEHTAYVERTNLTSRQMNGRLVRKTLSFSKELHLLEAASALEDALYNFTRPVRILRVELANPSKQARWQQRTPAMAAGLTDHIWTVKELLHFVLVPLTTNT